RLDRWSGGTSLQWQTHTDAEGRFTWDSPPEGTITFFINATNYSTMRMSFSGSFGEHTFNLRKISRVFGRVLHAETRNPFEDGTPVPNATVVLVDSSDSAYMDRPGELRRTGSSGDFQRSDLRGHFEFAPKFEAHTLVAAHDKGYAEVRASNILATGSVVLQPW